MSSAHSHTSSQAQSIRDVYHNINIRPSLTLLKGQHYKKIISERDLRSIKFFYHLCLFLACTEKSQANLQLSICTKMS
jgi:hypothetical protein